MQLVLLLQFLMALGHARSIISNVFPRVDTNGKILELADGCMTHHRGLYYYYGARYQPCPEPDEWCYLGYADIQKGFDVCQVSGDTPGKCCGWRNATVSLYTSRDLMKWEHVSSNVFPLMTDHSSPYSSKFNAYFEPCAMYNAKTDLWVLWTSVPYFKVVATSRDPAGPFKLNQWNVSGVAESADLTMWKDYTTDKVYIKQNSGPNNGLIISELSDDYLSVAANSEPFGYELGYSEGGGIFQYRDKWYVMSGHGCCFCTLGSNSYVFVADKPLGPYKLIRDVVGWLPSNASTTHAQHFGITTLFTKGGRRQPMYIGVRFGSAPDYRKNHDYQFWAPIEFDEHDQIQNITWIDEWVVDLA